MSGEFDLDPSGDLMDEIQRLVAPPQSSDPPRKSRIRDPLKHYYRKPGKAHNRDSCDSCHEGGDLLCCDQCPASFHLQCHDPPLEEDTVPPGGWLCHRCKTLPKVDEDMETASTCSSRSRVSEQSSSVGRRGASATSSRGHRLPEDDDWLESMDWDDEDANKNPLQLLAKAARFMNPKQFELPKDMACHVRIPGDSKWHWIEKDPKNGKKLQHKLDNGMVPLPAKTCFVCTRSCRVAPLLQCDFCPLLYHLDCLDPPLAAMPTDHWMCPNHVEHYIDGNLVDNVMLTDRIKLWNKYIGPVNQHSVKINFLKKIQRKNPPFRVKVRHAQRQVRIKVPDAIKAQYARRPPLLPSARDMPNVQLLRDAPQGDKLLSQLEQDQWLASIVGFHADVAKHLSSRKDVKKEPGSDQAATRGENKTDSNNKADPPPKESGKAEEGAEPDVKMEVKDEPTDNPTVPVSASESKSDVEVIEIKDEPAEDNTANDTKDFQQQQAIMPSSMLTNKPQLLDIRPPAPPGDCKQELWARALLCPLTGSGRSIPMTLRTLNIGASSSMDVCLESLGHCNYVSAKHASIFYDELSRQYELLNYSEHGTTVDNVLYSCDFSDKEATTRPPTRLVKSVRDVIDGLRGKRREAQRDKDDATMSAKNQRTNNLGQVCSCHTSCSSLIGASGAGWEGTALLHHGSYIKFGCLQFVFSIVGQSTDYRSARPYVKPENM